METGGTDKRDLLTKFTDEGNSEEAQGSGCAGVAAVTGGAQQAVRRLRRW